MKNKTDYDYLIGRKLVVLPSVLHSPLIEGQAYEVLEVNNEGSWSPAFKLKTGDTHWWRHGRGLKIPSPLELLAEAAE